VDVTKSFIFQRRCASAIAAHKNFGDAAGAQILFAARFRFDQILTPDNGHVAKTLHFGARKFESHQLSAGGAKFRGGAKDISLMLPLLFPGANHDGIGRHQAVKSVRIVGKPCVPNRLAQSKQFDPIQLTPVQLILPKLTLPKLTSPGATFSELTLRGHAMAQLAAIQLGTARGPGRMARADQRDRQQYSRSHHDDTTHFFPPKNGRDPRARRRPETGLAADQFR
jgi:hypothetical protein